MSAADMELLSFEIRFPDTFLTRHAQAALDEWFA
jgi:hypothetical protein